MPRRTTRAATARNLQSRQASLREAIAQENEGVLWYDPRLVPPGMVYGWIRRAVMNQEDAFTIRTRQQSGWQPVPADRHPELTTQGWGLPSEIQRPYIEIAGLILCEIPERLFKKNQERERIKAFEATRMPHLQDLGDQKVNKDLPVWNESETAFERVTAERVREQFKE